MGAEWPVVGAYDQIVDRGLREALDRLVDADVEERRYQLGARLTLRQRRLGLLPS